MAPRMAEDELLRARVRQQEATGSLGLAVLSGTDLPALMNQAVNVVAEMLSMEYCKVLELLPDGNRLLLRAGVGWKEGYIGRATVGTNLESQAGYTLISSGPVIVEELSTETRFDNPPLLREHGVVSGISTTIYVRGHAYGVLGAHTKRKREFTEDEVLFLQGVADVLGAAIERKRAESQTQSLLGERTEWAAAADRRFTFLSEANAQLSTSTDYPTVLATTARLAVPALANWCFLDVVEETGGTVNRFVVAHSDPEKGALAKELKSSYPLDPTTPHGTPKVLRTGRSELVQEIDETVLESIALDAEHLDILRRQNPRSYICVPLRVGGRTLGVMGLVSAGSGHRYDDEDLALAEGLAHCAALAIDNALHRVPQAEPVLEPVEQVKRDQQVVSPPRRREAPELTSRQLEVLRLLSEGRSAREISEELYLSQATVRNHIRSLLQALGAHSQLEALARAREMGVLPQ